VKIFTDGVPEAHTSFLLTPYIDRPGEDYGQPLMSKADLTEQITAYFSAGIPVHLHAVGDGAVRMSLDAVAGARQSAGNQDVRATIAHMDYVSPEDMPRFGELGVTAQTSIHFATRDPSYFFLASFVGTQKVEEAYPIRSLMDAGANQSFGTDWPASIFLATYEPLTSIEVAVTRRLPGNTEIPPRNPDESITVMEAITALTRNTAIQIGELDRLGTLAVGKYADLVLLEQDVFTIAPEAIHAVPVRLTMMGGKPVYRRVGDSALRMGGD
jgi:predicted amidohydrolase YtcJ